MKTSDEYEIQFIPLIGSGYEEEMLEWRNQEYVRKNMLNPNMILPEEHHAFLDKLKTNPAKEYFVALEKGVPFAVLNISYDEENVMETGMYITRQDRLDSGYGLIVEYAKCKYIYGKYPEATIVSRVLEHNSKTLKFHSSLKKEYKGAVDVTKNDGTVEKLHIFHMTKAIWEQQERVMKRNIAMIADWDKIQWIASEC